MFRAHFSPYISETQDLSSLESVLLKGIFQYPTLCPSATSLYSEVKRQKHPSSVFELRLFIEI